MITIPDGTIVDLVDVARKAPSADNMQPICFRWDGHRLVIGYDRERVANQTFSPSAPATLLALGSTLALLEDTATAWGLEPRWEPAANLPDETMTYGALRFHPNSPSTPRHSMADSPIRHTNRGSYTRKPLPEPVLSDIKGANLGNARVKVITQPEGIGDIALGVRRASELRFRIREVHEWLGHSLRFSRDEVAAGDGLDVKTLGLPPGGSLFLRLIRDWRRMRILNAIGGYKLVSAIDSAPVKVAPAMVAIIGERSPAGACEAGRLLHRVWQTLNHAGLAVHPYYVISDQLNRWREGQLPTHLESEAQTLAAQAQQTFELGEQESLHMLLRTGWPKREALTSQRLPVSRLLVTEL